MIMMNKVKRYIKNIQFKNKQRALEKEYKKEGGGEPSDELLEKQVELNQLRHKHNISDRSKRVHDNYVQ